MRNLLFFTILGSIVASCGTQKTSQITQKTEIKSTQEVSKVVNQPNRIATNTPKVEHIGQYDFFKTNINTVGKGENTTSYGSIVSANPTGYKVTRNYFPSLAQNFRQRFLILHYTAIDNEKSLRALTQNSVSAHYLVNDINDNEIYQLVDENKRAYHAGVSAWRKFDNLNDTSIGIEIVNQGYATDSQGFKVFYEYPEWQFRKIASLVKDIVTRYEISPEYVLAHSDIAPTRKQDPGPKFPWKRLYDEYGVGMWYDEATKMRYINTMDYELYNSSLFVYQYQNYLSKFGYKLELTGILDNNTKKVIEAFQYHFRPERCDGMMDVETWAILQALIEKYPAK